MAKRILTDELKEKLYGSMPFSSDGFAWHVPSRYKKDDIPEEYRPMFKLRSFKKSEITKAKSSLVSATTRTHDEAVSIIAPCILGWQNLFDLHSGEEIEYVGTEEKGLDKSLYEYITPVLESDLSLYIGVLSGLIDAEKLSLKY